MRPVKIVTDSTCDLNHVDIEALEIAVLPLHVTFKDKSYDDGCDIDVDTLYKLVKEHGETPKTAAITIMEFIEEFKKWISRGYDVIYTGISGAMSSTLNNAKIAISELGAEGQVMAIDSKNLSTGIGLVVLKAAKMAKEGRNILDVSEMMESTIEKVKSQFIIDTFEFLHKGGRCSGMARIFGSMLKIKPLIVVRDGVMSVARKPHGKAKALEALLEIIKNDEANLDRDVVMITHSKADEDAKYLEAQLKERLGLREVMITNAGCVISSHCGPGTIGILYITNSFDI